MAKPLTHNGKSYTNADAWRTARATSKPMAKPMGGVAEAELPGDEEQDGTAIANEHGPATEVHMTHDEAIGSHHVHSAHPDGHMHESDHASKEEAHEHGKKLAGIGGEGEGEHDEEESWGDE
jgi:hypothetical protein